MMIDNETLSAEIGGAIIAIGAVVFTEEAVIEASYIGIEPGVAPGHRSLSTMLWWSQQDEEIRERAFGGKLDVWGACHAFSQFAHRHADVECVWANSPSFDLVGLRMMYGSAGIEFPPFLAYYKERDFRTLMQSTKLSGNNALYKLMKLERDKNHAKHDALEDALAQAAAVQAWLRSAQLDQL